MPRSTRYEIRATYHDGWTEVCQANSRRVDALRDAKRISQTWDRIVRVWVTDTAPQMIEGRFVDVIFDITVGTDWAALGRQHAAYAIDQIDAYEDARASYEDNLRDTFAENHKGAPVVAVDIAVDAYNAVWNARKVEA